MTGCVRNSFTFWLKNLASLQATLVQNCNPPTQPTIDLKVLSYLRSWKVLPADRHTRSLERPFSCLSNHWFNLYLLMFVWYQTSCCMVWWCAIWEFKGNNATFGALAAPYCYIYLNTYCAYIDIGSGEGPEKRRTSWTMGSLWIGWHVRFSFNFLFRDENFSFRGVLWDENKISPLNLGLWGQNQGILRTRISFIQSRASGVKEENY